jgi:hypothetical protein
MKDKRTLFIERLFQVASVVILLLSVALAAVWLIWDDLPLEPVLVVLGLIYAEVPLLGRWLINKLDKELTREKFSMPYALAYGYLTNYLAPVVKQLRKEAGPKADALRFYVYLPRSLDELSGDSISEILDELENRSYQVETLEIEFPGSKRRRDFRTARKLPVGEGTAETVKYFDFPTTLLTLEQAVEYKLDTREGSFPFRQREALGKEYIDHFRMQLVDMLSARKYETIRDHIKIVDGGFDFLDAEEASGNPV